MTHPTPPAPAREPLLPCPFCGAAPEYLADDSYGACHITCLADTCPAGPSVQALANDYDDAAGLWNNYRQQRAPAAVPPAAGGVALAERLAAVLHDVMAQVESDLKSAHAVIAKLQGLDPTKVTWPAWSPQANTLRWFAKLRAEYPRAGHLAPAPADWRDIAFIWRWVERGLFDNMSTDALGVLAHHPSAPWNCGEWDVTHKPYAEAFYAKFPNARPAPPAVAPPGADGDGGES